MLSLAILTLALGVAAPSDDDPFIAENPAVQAGADRSIEVVLRSGRRLQAELDPRSTAEQLQLRWRRENISLAQAFAWDEVAGATIAGQLLEAEEFRQLVTRAVAERPASATAGVFVLRGDPDSPLPRPAAPSTRRVYSLDISGQLGHWTGGAESDGIVLNVRPMDEFGRLVPIDGTLAVELVGQSASMALVGPPVIALGRWSVVVRPDDFGPSGAQIKLPFQALDPRRDSSLLPHAMVAAKLSVPGQGTFEATDNLVRIRAFNPIRDRRELYTGQR